MADERSGDGHAGRGVICEKRQRIPSRASPLKLNESQGRLPGGVDGFRGHTTLKRPIHRGESDPSRGTSPTNRDHAGRGCLRRGVVPRRTGKPVKQRMNRHATASVAGRLGFAWRAIFLGKPIRDRLAAANRRPCASHVSLMRTQPEYTDRFKRHARCGGRHGRWLDRGGVSRHSLSVSASSRRTRSAPRATVR